MMYCMRSFGNDSSYMRFFPSLHFFTGAEEPRTNFDEAETAEIRWWEERQG